MIFSSVLAVISSVFTSLYNIMALGFYCFLSKDACMKFSVDSARCPCHENTLGVQLFSLPLRSGEHSVENSSTFGTLPSSSMSLFPTWPIKKGAGGTMSTLSTIVEEELILDVTDNPLIYSRERADKRYRKWINGCMDGWISCILQFMAFSSSGLYFAIRSLGNQAQLAGWFSLDERIKP